MMEIIHKADGFETGVERSPSRFGKARMIVLALLVVSPLALAGSFRLCQIFLANQAMASVSDDAFLPSTADQATAIKVLKAQVLSDPSRLEKFDRRLLLAVFDQPALRRAEGHYRHWQYVSDRCVMDIYMKLETSRYTNAPVQFIDFSPRHKASYRPGAGNTAGNDSVDRGLCLQSLLQPRAITADLQ